MVSTTKKIRGIFLLAIIFIASIFIGIPTFAKNNVSNISIDVVVHDNGSATITQQWQGRFNEGTEVYLPIQDESLIIKNFKVSMNGREFITAEKWDVNASFQNKSFRSGINKTRNGIELCFGISNYGDNVYIFSYDVDPLVKSYPDADGFNFQFVNPNMSTTPTSVVLRIGMENGVPLTENNARIWGFGFNGDVRFVDNYVVAFTTSPIEYNNYMNIMVGLYKGIISPNVKGKGTFEDLKDIAFEDSVYKMTLEEQKSGVDLYTIVVGLIFGGVIISAIAGIIYKIRRKMALKKFYKEVNYFRDVPNGGHIPMSHAIFRDFDIWNSKESNVVGAIIMKMINDKNLEPIQEKSYGFFGREKINTSLKVGPEPQNPIFKDLYRIIIQAAGSDGILQENELKKYAEDNYNALNDYLDYLLKNGKNLMNSNDCYVKAGGKDLKSLSDRGKEELAQVYGLRKFLDEFTLISERGVTEGIIWEDMMVYATLFGIAKKVLSELKRVYPDRIVEIDNYAHTYYISDSYYRTLYYSSVSRKRAIEAAKWAKMAADGLGGAASISGGGGFSGGGSGGGTR